MLLTYSQFHPLIHLTNYLKNIVILKEYLLTQNPSLPVSNTELPLLNKYFYYVDVIFSALMKHMQNSASLQAESNIKTKSKMHSAMQWVPSLSKQPYKYSRALNYALTYIYVRGLLQKTFHDVYIRPVVVQKNNVCSP